MAFLVPLVVVLAWAVHLLISLDPDDDDTDEFEEPIEFGDPVGAYGLEPVRIRS